MCEKPRSNELTVLEQIKVTVLNIFTIMMIVNIVLIIIDDKCVSTLMQNDMNVFLQIIHLLPNNKNNK
jgi:hypothetical protein